MKVLSLNTWGGRAGKENLLRFFNRYRDVDVFCLQEIWSAPYADLEGYSAGGMRIDHSNIMVYGMQEISALLDTHNAYFKPHHRENYGLMTLVKKNWDVLSEGDVFVHKQRGHTPEGDIGNHARNVQFVTISTDKSPRSILNFHGLWNGSGKGDSDDRLTQSDRIIQFLETVSDPVVLCGDFNLLPDTRSLKKLEEYGLRNLIKECGITSTRSSFYTKPEKFADYVLVSKEITVNNFRVLTDEVSDHLPLLLDFE